MQIENQRSIKGNTMYIVWSVSSLAGIDFIRFLDIPVLVPLFRLISVSSESLTALAASSCFSKSTEGEKKKLRS